MLDLKQIEQKLRQKISTLCELKEYYDSIFHEGIFLSMAEFYELNRLFTRRTYLINGDMISYYADLNNNNI
jgi:hypothetical protein